MSHPPKQNKQNKQSPRRQLILLIALSAAIIILVFIAVGWVYREFITPIPYDLSYLEGFISLLTLAALSGGFVFWIIDRRQSEKTLSFQQFQDIHDRMVTLEQEEARRWIITTIPVKSDNQLIEEWFSEVTALIEHTPRGWKEDRSPGQTYLKKVLNNLDFIGFISQHFWEARTDEIDWLSPPVAKVWQRIGPYVEHIADLRSEPDYYISARQFGEFCIDWREKKGLPEPRIVEGL